jgi:hypothetical protein
MPIHDWTRGVDAYYHSFQLGWTSELSARLNRNLLPSSHFALTETIELRPSIRFQQLPEPDFTVVDTGHPGTCRDDTPSTRFTATDRRRQYANVGITIRHAEHHQPVAAVLWVTRQYKQTPYRFRSLMQIAIGAITHGVHLLIVDLFPPTDRDPQGIHKAIWDEFTDDPFELPPGKPLTLVGYQSGDEFTAHIEPVAVGDPMPDMPLYLDRDLYVKVPLESTYQATWEACPEPIRELVQGSG